MTIDQVYYFAIGAGSGSVLTILIGLLIWL